MRVRHNGIAALDPGIGFTRFSTKVHTASRASPGSDRRTSQGPRRGPLPPGGNGDWLAESSERACPLFLAPFPRQDGPPNGTGTFATLRSQSPLPGPESVPISAGGREMGTGSRSLRSVPVPLSSRGFLGKMGRAKGTGTFATLRSQSPLPGPEEMGTGSRSLRSVPVPLSSPVSSARWAAQRGQAPSLRSGASPRSPAQKGGPGKGTGTFATLRSQSPLRGPEGAGQRGQAPSLRSGASPRCPAQSQPAQRGQAPSLRSGASPRCPARSQNETALRNERFALFRLAASPRMRGRPDRGTIPPAPRCERAARGSPGERALTAKMDEQSGDPTDPLPERWQGVVTSRLAPGERVLAWFTPDLDSRLHFREPGRAHRPPRAPRRGGRGRGRGRGLRLVGMADLGGIAAPGARQAGDRHARLLEPGAGRPLAVHAGSWRGRAATGAAARGACEGRAEGPVFAAGPVPLLPEPAAPGKWSSRGVRRRRGSTRPPRSFAWPGSPGRGSGPSCSASRSRWRAPRRG